jgi:hypothetical protein
MGVMWLLSAGVSLQALLSFSVDTECPVRFGWKVPAAALTRGLSLRGDPSARMQWRLLQESPGVSDDGLWIVVELCGHDGPARLLLGGDPPVAPGQEGPVCQRTILLQDGEDGRERTEIDRWLDGTEDQRVLRTVGTDARGSVQSFEDRGSVLARRLPVRIAASEWRRIGVLPRADGVGRAHRRELLALVPRLPQAPGGLGMGDFTRGRQGETVTNLEFDTTLGFLRLALCEEDDACLQRALAAARHIVDVDLDAQSGLPFRHGPDHRVARPEPGHVWVTGLAMTGAVFGERELFDAGLGIAQALAGRVLGPEPREGRFDRMRDEAWPLHELEQILRLVDHPSLRRSADAVAARLLARFDPAFRCVRYGEGETRAGEVYRDRLWLSLGLAVPALALHAQRTRNPDADEAVASMRRLGIELLEAGRPGLPLGVLLEDGAALSATRSRGVAEGYLLLEGLSPHALRAVLGRRSVRSALDGALDPRHEDIATRFSIAARCEWVAR